MYDIEAAFFRASKGGEEQLQPDGRVAPGDELFLKMQSSVPLHVYVVDEDDKGAAFLLFPLRGDRLTNPLPAGQSVIVPGATRWQVTSQGEREHFLVFASPEPLDSLEEAFARLPEPRVGMPDRRRPAGEVHAGTVARSGGPCAGASRAERRCRSGAPVHAAIDRCAQNGHAVYGCASSRWTIPCAERERPNVVVALSHLRRSPLQRQL